MIGREKRVLLRHYLEQGMPKAEIARQLEISRRTVYNWIEAGELDRGADSKAVRYGPRPRRPSKLDPYKGIIDARLAEYPKLSAVRLFNEVRAAGYGGGYGQVKRYVREVRPRSATSRSPAAAPSCSSSSSTAATSMPRPWSPRTRASSSGARSCTTRSLPPLLLDRLLHRCHIVNIRGNSYRMRRHMELSKAIHPTASRAVSAEHAGNGKTGS